jgi:BirA family transcriptional regulator, biotin operon repressor / biotin---[acetyl-CoA-carboxylase] ligase
LAKNCLIRGYSHQYFCELDSTNEYALRWGREGAPHFALVTADSQTAGRGRRGRSWSSPPGAGLYLSLVVRPVLQSELLLPCLNFAACLAATRAVREVSGLTCKTKWPNDVLLGGKKIAGVLSEAVWREAQLDFAVIGIGLNVNHGAHDLPPRPLYPASSLLLESGKIFEIEMVRDSWLKHFAAIYKRVEKGDTDSIRDEFWRRCAQRDKSVTVNAEDGEIRGTALALARDGALLLETPRGVRRIVAGDVSVSGES